MTDPDLEQRIRTAFQERAAHAPSAAAAPLPAPAARPRRDLRRPLLAASVAACLAVGAVIAAVRTDERGTMSVQFAEGGAEGERDFGPVPRLGFDQAGFAFEHVDDCDGLGADVPEDSPRMQTFASSYAEPPMVFLQTVEPAQLKMFGLVGPEGAEAFTARGRTGYADPKHSSGAGWNLSLELADGRALYAIVLGADLAQLVPFLEGLTPRADGLWDARVLLPGLRELPRSTMWSRCPYSARGKLADIPGTLAVHLYGDRFDARLADRVSSTTGTVDRVSIDGVPGVLGSYRADDHWVMFEPQPGRSMEIRLSGMSRGDVLRVLARARFVDEESWRGMKPS